MGHAAVWRCWLFRLLVLHCVCSRPATATDASSKVEGQRVAAIAKAASNTIEECRRATRNAKSGRAFESEQDWFVLVNFFWDRDHKGLTYLDIGANTPVVQSNSWFMDQCLGWRGVCAEPNPALARKIRNSVRTCTVYNGCVSDKPGELFLQGYSGMSVVGEELTTEHQYTHVDFASIDVERHELFVLAGWPARVPVDVITIEINDFSPTLGLNTLWSLLQRGYTVVGDVGDDFQLVRRAAVLPWADRVFPDIRAARHPKHLIDCKGTFPPSICNTVLRGKFDAAPASEAAEVPDFGPQPDHGPSDVDFCREAEARGRDSHKYALEYSQDWFVMSNFFESRGQSFIEVSAGHWRDDSATYYMEQCASWTGVCMVPTLKLAAEWRAHRRCRVFVVCAAPGQRDCVPLHTALQRVPDVRFVALEGALATALFALMPGPPALGAPVVLLHNSAPAFVAAEDTAFLVCKLQCTFYRHSDTCTDPTPADCEPLPDLPDDKLLRHPLAWVNRPWPEKRVTGAPRPWIVKRHPLVPEILVPVMPLIQAAIRKNQDRLMELVPQITGRGGVVFPTRSALRTLLRSGYGMVAKLHEDLVLVAPTQPVPTPVKWPHANAPLWDWMRKMLREHSPEDVVEKTVTAGVDAAPGG